MFPEDQDGRSHQGWNVFDSGSADPREYTVRGCGYRDVSIIFSTLTLPETCSKFEDDDTDTSAQTQGETN